MLNRKTWLYEIPPILNLIKIKSEELDIQFEFRTCLGKNQAEPVCRAEIVVFLSDLQDWIKTMNLLS